MNSGYFIFYMARESRSTVKRKLKKLLLYKILFCGIHMYITATVTPQFFLVLTFTPQDLALNFKTLISAIVHDLYSSVHCL